MTCMPPFFHSTRRRWRRSNRIVRLIVASWALGLALGAGFALAMLALDTFGLRTLLRRSDVAALGTVLFVSMFALTFGGVVAAAAAMQAGRDDDDEPRGGRRARGYALAYVTAPRGAR